MSSLNPWEIVHVCSTSVASLTLEELDRMEQSVETLDEMWGSLGDATAPLSTDRPLSTEVRAIRGLLREASMRPCAERASRSGP
jgi:hypothetical protein